MLLTTTIIMLLLNFCLSSIFMNGIELKQKLIRGSTPYEFLVEGDIILPCSNHMNLNF